MSGGFQDHFSARADRYAVFRPIYPAALYQWLGTQVARHDAAWDCGTGNGQAALGLAPFFEHVFATDASPSQLAQATPGPNIEYRVATAECSGLPDHSVDLVTVAQAAHWFDRPRFFAEVARVARPGSVVAIWMYNLMEADPAVNRLIWRLYSDIVGPFWPGDRVLIDTNYRSIEIPFPEFDSPAFEITADWSGDHLLGYLRTWSAVNRYVEAKGHDPVALIEPELVEAWGGRDVIRTVRWPLRLRTARIVGGPSALLTA